jgi:hypothetical protein
LILQSCQTIYIYAIVMEELFLQSTYTSREPFNDDGLTSSAPPALPLFIHALFNNARSIAFFYLPFVIASFNGSIGVPSR